MVELNLLPKSQRKRSEPTFWTPAAIALIPLTAAILAVPTLQIMGKINAAVSEKQNLESQISALAPDKKKFDDLTAKKQRIEAVTNVSQQLKNNKSYWSNDISDFTAQMPTGNGIALKSMNITMPAPGQATDATTTKPVSREFVVQGSATSQQSVVNFLKAYENNPRYVVSFNNMSSEKNEEKGTQLYGFGAKIGLVKDQTAASGTPTDPNAPAPASSTPAAPAAPAPAAPAPAAPGGA